MVEEIKRFRDENSDCSARRNGKTLSPAYRYVKMARSERITRVPGTDRRRVTVAICVAAIREVIMQIHFGSVMVA